MADSPLDEAFKDGLGFFQSFEAPADEIEALVDQLAILSSMTEQVRERRREFMDKLGALMGQYRVDLPDRGLKLMRHPRVSRRNWQHDDLLRAVKDSVVADKGTGEIQTETAEEKLIAVYGLRGYQAKIGELKKRRIRVDEFCDVDEPKDSWDIEVRK